MPFMPETALGWLLLIGATGGALVGLQQIWSRAVRPLWHAGGVVVDGAQAVKDELLPNGDDDPRRIREILKEHGDRHKHNSVSIAEVNERLEKGEDWVASHENEHAAIEKAIRPIRYPALEDDG